jgi:hypothetical protein
MLEGKGVSFRGNLQEIVIATFQVEIANAS